MPANAGPWVERKILPMFSRCKIARTPGICSAAAVSSVTTRPLAIVASTGTAYSIPGKWKSEAYCAFPVTFNGPSTRGVLRPIGDVVGASCVVGMFGYSLGNLGRKFQRVHETASGQLDLEAVFALRLRPTQRRLRRFSEDGFCCRLAC